MQLTGEIIERINTLYSKGASSQDSRLSDRYIYHKMLTVRSKLIYQQASKKKSISDFNYSVIRCIEVIKVDENTCPCLPSRGCEVYRTKEMIPKPISSFNAPLIDYIYSNDNKIRFSKSDRIEYQYQKDSKYANSKPVYIVENNFIYFYGKNLPTVVNIKILLEDPLQAYTMPTLCSTEGLLTDNCIDPRDLPFAIDAHLIEDLIEMCKKELVGEFSVMSDDITNNRQDDRVNYRNPPKND